MVLLCLKERMTFTVDKIQPEYIAQICPNCNGRGTVGLNPVRPCPTCGSTDHKGVVYVPARMKESYDNKNNLY